MENEVRRGMTRSGVVAAHRSDGMSVRLETGETAFVPSLLIRDNGVNDPPPVGSAVTVVELGRDTRDRLIVSARLADLAGTSMRPVAAQDSCDWCYSAATPTSRAESERLGLVEEQAYACDACLAVEAFRQTPPDGWYEDANWPFLLPDSSG